MADADFPWTGAARWAPDQDTDVPVHLLTGHTADNRYLAWVQVTSWRGGADGWWTGNEDLITAARRERGLLRDPDDVALMAGAVVRVLGAGGRPDSWTRMVARIGERREVLVARGER